LWGLNFFLRPLSLVLIGLITLTIAYAIYKSRKPAKKVSYGAGVSA
jgi:hypothetical protein